MLKARRLVLLGSVGAVVALGAVAAPAASAASNPSGQQKLTCWWSTSLCTEIADPQAVWGSWYVGHDEPSLLFYSNRPGSGNDMTYRLKIPSEPSGPYSQSKSYNFELHPAFWFGMALCDTQSYPETTSQCQPDSDRNIVDVTKSIYHPGTAFMELQFYPPGWVKEFNGTSCDATKWCAALNIDSYSLNPITGQALNTTCQSEILGGVEYVNYAYLTRNGQPQGPPDPLHFDPVASGDPGPNVLYMNPGDDISVSLHDSSQGLVTTLYDLTTHQTGWMTASAANGFGQIQFAPTGTSCTEIPYNFHPEYSTSSPQTRVPWAAHTYNVAYSDEIGHWDFCTAVDPNTGNCTGLEGAPGDQEPTDGDDYGCFDASMSLLYPATGCLGTNDPGFDGSSYQPDWPDGSPNHPTPILLSSPRTNGAPYQEAAFETDLPRIEASDYGGPCNRTSGAGCTDPPLTDEGAPANFYPYFSTVRRGGHGGGDHGGGHGCLWGEGSTLPNTIDNFGGTAASEFGSLNPQAYYVTGGGGATHFVIDTYRRILPNAPC